MAKHKQLLGAKGERLARRFLSRKGYKILVRNFSCRFGEIDLIARQGSCTVFIEVKTRSSDSFGLPEEAINAKKIKHLLHTAQFYIQRYSHPEGEFRFDLVSIIITRPTKIYLIKDIF